MTNVKELMGLGVPGPLAPKLMEINGVGSTITNGTQGSSLFVGAGGVLAQDNANLYYHEADKVLSLGTNSRDAAFTSAFGNPGVISVKNPSGVGDNFVGVSVGSHVVGARVYGAKHRGASGTAPTTPVQDGDNTLTLAGYGATGTAYARTGYQNFEVDGTVSSTSMPGRCVISTTTAGFLTQTERMRLDSNGAVIINSGGNKLSSAAGGAFGTSGGLFISKDNSQANNLICIGTGANASGPTVILAKTRDASGTDAATIVQSGDDIGVIEARGATGTTFRTGGRMRFVVDGTPGSGTDMPARWVLELAPDGSATPVEYMRVSNSGAYTYPSTSTAAGVTGAQTINKVSGSVNFAAAATTLVVTNSLCTVNSYVFATILTNDATATIKNVIPAAGSFTIRLNAAATAETKVAFFIIN